MRPANATNDAPRPNYFPRLTELVRSFPILHGAPCDPWEALKLYRWAQGPRPESARHAARFVIGVFNPSTLASFDYGRRNKLGPFDLHRAMGAWDNHNRAAFLAWARAPWWA